MNFLYAKTETFKPSHYVESKVVALHKYFTDNKRTNLVIGISGGVDSAVTLALLSKLSETYPGVYTVTAVIAPIEGSIGTTEQYEAFTLACKVCKKYQPEVEFLPLRAMSRMANKTLNLGEDIYLQQQVDYWLRPTAFYSVAMKNDSSILVSTINYDEWILGWFSQYLDVLGVHPIVDINKEQVYELATFLEVPDDVTRTPPKGGLADGSTDEESLGFTYKELWTYYNNPSTLHQSVKDTIKKRISDSEFKRFRFNPSFIFATTVIPKD